LFCAPLLTETDGRSTGGLEAPTDYWQGGGDNCKGNAGLFDVRREILHWTTKPNWPLPAPEISYLHDRLHGEQAEVSHYLDRKFLA